MDDGEVIGVMRVEEAITGINLSGKHIRHGPNQGQRGNNALPKTDIVARGCGDSCVRDVLA